MLPVLLALLLLADPQEQLARSHFEQAEKLYQQSLYEEALNEYQEAYDLKPLAAFLFNIGQCHRNLGHYSEAISAFESYLRAKPDARNRDATEALLAELRERVRRGGAGPTAGPGPSTGTASGSRLRSTPPRSEATTAPGVDTTTKLDYPEVRSRPKNDAFYKTWWFWTAVGVVAIGAGAGTYLLLNQPTEIPNATLPSIRYP